ncbi:hypothetical protein BRC95_04980 [Halobacteriales archaeon QS_5_68_33]|nr:MAG: hypothetical protein BRC95_04980 [Halobacteriales archaeon QS_5_68_33]
MNSAAGRTKSSRAWYSPTKWATRFTTHGVPTAASKSKPRLFRSTDETEQAVALSERLHGPMIETDGPFIDYRKGSDKELAAAVFASRIIEPTTAQRIAPDAVRRLEEVFGDLSDNLF